MEFVGKELNEVHVEQLRELLLAINMYTDKLIISMVVAKSDEDDIVISDSDYFDIGEFNHYSSYLGYYLSYSYIRCNEKRIDQIKDIISRSDLYVLDSSFVANYVSNLHGNYQDNVEMLRFLMEFVYSIGDGVNNLDLLLDNLKSYSSIYNGITENMINDAYEELEI